MNSPFAAPLRRLTGIRAAAGHGPVLVAALVGCAVLLRLIYCAQVELLPEETYYWNYSRHLDFGYLDHPPMVAWLIRFGTAIFGDTAFGVRFGALCCGAITSLFVFRLTYELFGDRSALLALCLAQLLPFFFLAAMLMTPDAPLTAAWAASLYYLQRALIAGRARAWLWAGLWLGIGLISKYTIALLGTAAVLFMLCDPPSRKWFYRWEPYAASLIAAAVFAPVIIWNAEHEWASFAFQTSRRLAEAPRFSLHKLIAAAMVLLTPTGLLAAATVLWRPAPRSTPRRLLQFAVWLPLGVFTLFSLRHEVKLDWTGAPWTAALPLMAAAFCEAGGAAGRDRPAASRWLRAAWPPTLGTMLLIYSFGLYYLVLGIPGLGYTQHTELVPVEWRNFARQIDDVADGLRARYGEQFLVVGMDRYAIASELAFYSRDQTAAVGHTSSAHLFGDEGLMYERWFPAAAQTGRTLLLVSWKAADLDAARLAPRVEALEPMREGVLMRDGRVVRHYFYRIAHGYHYP